MPHKCGWCGVDNLNRYWMPVYDVMVCSQSCANFIGICKKVRFPEKKE